MIELAAFDIAGTTVEEHSAVYAALTDAVTAAGAAVGGHEVAAWMGADKREAITGLLTGGGSPPSPELVDATYADFRRRLDARYAAVPPTPMPGVEATFAALRAAGVRIALTTGFDRAVTDGLLRVLGWDTGVLDAVVCVDDVAAGRPAPYMVFRAMELTGVRAVERVLVAGDTVRDLESGHNAGAGLVVGVRSGGVADDVLGAAPHTHLLDSVADLPALLDLG